MFNRLLSRYKMSIYREVAVIVPAFLPNEYLTIEKTIRYLLDTVEGINKDNLYLVYNVTKEEEETQLTIYSDTLQKLRSICQVVYVKGSSSKSENLNEIIDILPTNFKYIAIYDADARPSSSSIVMLYTKIVGLSKEYAYVQGAYTHSRGNNSLVLAYDEVENLFHNKFLGKYFCTNYMFKGHDGIFKLDILKRIGGFNEKALTEDFEISVRLENAGYRGMFLDTHISSSESPAKFRDFIRQRLRWYSGFCEMSPLGFLGRLIVAIAWIALNIWIPLPTLVFSVILGLLVTRFNLILTVVFLAYPFFIVLMSIYFLIKGRVKVFKSTPRDIDISGGRIYRRHYTFLD